MSQVLIAIDGANFGSLDPRTGNYRNSFVRRIYERASKPKQYFDGPGAVVGAEIGDVARRVTDWLRHNSRPGDGLHFVGYSRGAAACFTAVRAMGYPGERPDSELLPGFAGRFVISMSLFDPVANRPFFPEASLRRQEQHIAIFCARRTQEDRTSRQAFPMLPISGTGPVFRNRPFIGNHTDLGGHNNPSPGASLAYQWIL